MTVCNGRRLNVANKAKLFFVLLSVKLVLSELAKKEALQRKGVAHGTAVKMLVSLYNCFLFTSLRGC